MDEELKKTAMGWGKKLFDFGKDVAKKAADEAGKAYSEFEQKRKDDQAMEAREGSFYSQFSVDDLWMQMARDLTPNIGHLGVNLKADPDILRITTFVQYTEQIPGVVDVIRQLTCYVDFQAQENGTLILYRWQIYEIPPNGYLNTNIVRTINKRIRTCAQLGPQAPGGMQ